MALFFNPISVFEPFDEIYWNWCQKGDYVALKKRQASVSSGLQSSFYNLTYKPTETPDCLFPQITAQNFTPKSPYRHNITRKTDTSASNVVKFKRFLVLRFKNGLNIAHVCVQLLWREFRLTDLIKMSWKPFLPHPHALKCEDLFLCRVGNLRERLMRIVEIFVLRKLDDFWEIKKVNNLKLLWKFSWTLKASTESIN